MISKENRRVPSLRFHKASGQSYVVLSGKAIYCGKPDDPATQQRYHQAIAEWLAAGQQPIANPMTITIKELLAWFWTHAEQYYQTLTDASYVNLNQFLSTRFVESIAEGIDGNGDIVGSATDSSGNLHAGIRRRRPADQKLTNSAVLDDRKVRRPSRAIA